MTNFMTLSRFKSWQSLPLLIATIIVVAFVGVGCDNFDDSFGGDYTPSSQDMSLQTWESNSCFTTSLIKSDSIRSSNVGLAVMGAERRDIFGERRAGFFTQFIPLNELNEDDDDDWESEYPFGYEPIFDSLMFLFTLVEYSGDTTVCQEFAVYEARDVDFLSTSNTFDSVFFDSFNTSLLDLTPEPIFTFTFPDPDQEVYMSSTAVRLYPTDTDASQSFIDKLLLMDDEADNEIYDFDDRDLFLDKFKGIYIKPITELTEDPSSTLDSVGATYSFYTEGSGLGFYARSRYKSDPSIIKDTTVMSFTFRTLTTYILDDAYLGITINTLERSREEYEVDVDYTTLHVEGMGGVASKITLTKDFFEEIEDKLAKVPDNNGEICYNTIFVNQALINIYAPEEFIPLMNSTDENYDISTIEPLTVTPWLNTVPTRLGMYENYVDYYADEDDYDDDNTMLDGISDYYFEYEVYYGVALPYGGYLNRSTASYEMTVSAQLQDAWNSYLEAKEDAGGDVSQINWDDVEHTSFILAPVADGLYTVKYASLQGMQGGTNNAPMRLRMTYTLIK
ncbi:MAG: DUF4270 family protein [Rikenellaceae bacterium]